MMATPIPQELRRRTVVHGLLGAGLASALPATAQTAATASIATPAPPAGRETVSWKLVDDQPALRAWWQAPVGSKPKAHIVVLHGSGEVGDELQAPLRNGVDKFMNDAVALGWAVCTPQLEGGRTEWDIPRLHALAQRLKPLGLPLQVLGISMGGYAVWNWLWQYGGDLTAAVSMCGGGPERTTCSSHRVPVRAYHGAHDDVVMPAWQQAQVDAHKACGGSAEFIVYPDANHGVWIPAFEDAALLPWLGKHLVKPAVMTSGKG